MSEHVYTEANLPLLNVGLQPVYTTMMMVPGLEGGPHRQWVYRLENGFGLSVIDGAGTYSDAGTYEIVIARWADHYDFHGQWAMMGDPLGFVTEDQIVDALLVLSKLHFKTLAADQDWDTLLDSVFAGN